MKTPMIVLVAALLLGLTSSALATDPFGLHAYQPAFHANEHSATAPVRAQVGSHVVFAQLLPAAADQPALFDRMIRPE